MIIITKTIFINKEEYKVNGNMSINTRTNKATLTFNSKISIYNLTINNYNKIKNNIIVYLNKFDKDQSGLNIIKSYDK